MARRPPKLGQYHGTRVKPRREAPREDRDWRHTVRGHLYCARTLVPSKSVENLAHGVPQPYLVLNVNMRKPPPPAPISLPPASQPSSKYRKLSSKPAFISSKMTLERKNDWHAQPRAG